MLKFTPGRNKDEEQFDKDVLDSIRIKHIHMDPAAHLDNGLQTLFVQNQLIISMLRDIDTKLNGE